MEWKELLENQRYARLMLLEELEGERFEVKLKKSNIALVGGDNVSISYSGPEALKDVMRDVASQLFPAQGIEEMAINVVKLKPDSYLFDDEQDAWALESCYVKDLRGREGRVNHGNIHEFAGLFQLIAPSVRPLPACMLYAIESEEFDKAQEIIDNVTSGAYSEFGKYDFKPSFSLVLALAYGDEEAELKWTI